MLLYIVLLLLGSASASRTNNLPARLRAAYARQVASEASTAPSLGPSDRPTSPSHRKPVLKPSETDPSSEEVKAQETDPEAVESSPKIQIGEQAPVGTPITSPLESSGDNEETRTRSNGMDRGSSLLPVSRPVTEACGIKFPQVLKLVEIILRAPDLQCDSPGAKQKVKAITGIDYPKDLIDKFYGQQLGKYNKLQDWIKGKRFRLIVTGAQTLAYSLRDSGWVAKEHIGYLIWACTWTMCTYIQEWRPEEDFDTADISNTVFREKEFLDTLRVLWQLVDIQLKKDDSPLNKWCPPEDREKKFATWFRKDAVHDYLLVPDAEQNPDLRILITDFKKLHEVLQPATRAWLKASMRAKMQKKTGKSDAG